MMTALILNSLLLMAGVYFGVRNVLLLRSESALRAYMQSSPKAVFWVRKYGLDGASKMARESFIPLGLVVSFGMIALSAWNLWRILGR